VIRDTRDSYFRSYINDFIGLSLTLISMEQIPSIPSVKATPRDVFLQLLSVGTLYVSAVSLIALLFQYVNRLIPDPLSFDYGIGDALRRSIATIIVVFPVYVVTAWYFQKESISQPERREIKIRKWLVYLTLFVSAVTVIVDLVTLVYKFLGGELSPRFALKVLAVLIVAAGVFWYYLWDLRRQAGALSVKMKNVLRAIVVIIGGVIIGGFFLVGSPQSQRLLRFDQQRINDLNIIQQEIINYWQQKDTLPQSLDELESDISGFRPPVDPETGSPYDYRVLGDLTFELCATFKTVGEIHAEGYPKPIAPRGDPYQQNWGHGIGRTCFSRTIDPELYRDRGNSVKPIPPLPVAPNHD